MALYLIAQYYPGSGETPDKPRCLFGNSGSYVIAFPPEKVKADCCYKSQKRAENYAAKCNGYSRSARYAAYDVSKLV